MEKIQRKRIWRGKGLEVIFMALIVCCLAAVGAQAALIDLGAAGPQNWAVLTLGNDATNSGGDFTLTSSHVTGVLGNVGVDNGIATITSGSSISGKLVIETGHTVTNLGTITGGVQQNAAGDALLASSRADAIARSAFYAGLAPTNATFTNMVINSANNSFNITGLGLVIATVSSISSTGITVTGGAGDAIVFNLPAFASITTFQGLDAQGVLSPLNVLLNSQISNDTYSYTGDSIEGIWLSPFSDYILSGGQVGEAIARSVQFHSDTTITNPFVPVPPSAILLGSGLLGLGLFGSGRKWFRRI